jgi:histone deacetylase 6
MGFCIYNNVGVAAKWVIQKFPRQVQRVLIIDWDVQYLHHMNLINVATAMAPNEYFMKTRTFFIFRFIVMMMEHSVFSIETILMRSIYGITT